MNEWSLLLTLLILLLVFVLGARSSMAQGLFFALGSEVIPGSTQGTKQGWGSVACKASALPLHFLWLEPCFLTELF